jgi:MFS transporter, MHS family, proline/betaine transporter
MVLRPFRAFGNNGLTQPPGSLIIHKGIIATVIGNIVEWYDVALFVQFSFILSKLFLADDEFNSSISKLFIIFAISYFIRPLGSIFFGHIGDVYGRRMALLLSIGLITFATFSITLIPTYNDIGSISTALLLFSRALQGFAASGEIAGATIFLAESSPHKKQGFLNSLVMATTMFGFMLGMISALLATVVFNEKILWEYGWKIPFSFSLLLGSITFFLRLSSSESDIFLTFKKGNIEKEPSTKSSMIKNNHLYLIIGSTIILATSSYLITSFFPTYFIMINFSAQQAFLLSLIGMLILTISIILFGYYSDSLGHEKILHIGLISIIFICPIIFFLINSKLSCLIISGFLIFCLCLSPMMSTICLCLAMSIPVSHRYTVFCLGYNVSMCLFGGTAPYLANLLVKKYQGVLPVGGYIIISGIISFLSLRQLKSKNKQNL